MEATLLRNRPDLLQGEANTWLRPFSSGTRVTSAILQLIYTSWEDPSDVRLNLVSFSAPLILGELAREDECLLLTEITLFFYSL